MQSIKNCLNHPNLALFYGFFDVLNLTFTVSFLIIPYWFYNAGLLFGIASLALSIALGGISSFWVLEFLGRASFLHRSQEYSCINEDGGEIIPKIDPDRKYEFNELSKIIMGKIASFLVSLVVIVTGILMIFNGIIPGSQALAVNIPINASVFTACNSSEFDVGILPGDPNCVNWYRLMVVIFGLMGTILSCLGSKEQIYVIVFLSVLRLVVMSYMMGFSVYVMIAGSAGNNTIETGFVTHYDMSNGMLATAAFFSLLYLPTLVPSVTHSIPNKSRLRLLIIISLASLTVFLSLYGTILSFAFGSSIHPNSILNLQPYTMDEYSWFLKIISHIILIYPCLDGISSFMYGVILASNQTFTILTGKDYSEVSKKRKFQLLNLAIYLCFSIFPTFACLFISNISIILDVSGLVIFISNIIIPSILQISSNVKCRRLINRVLESGSQLKKVLNFLFKASFPTPDSGFYSSTFMVLLITTIASVIFAISFGYLIASFF